MSASNEDPIVLSYHDSLLRQSDIELLEGPHWLNDHVKNLDRSSIISFYFEYLVNHRYKSNRDFLFIAPEVTQCIKIVPETDLNIFLEPLGALVKLYIFFALNDNDSPSRAGGSHWSLLVFSRPERTFYHFDSSGISNLSHCQYLVQKIKYALNCPTAKCKSVSSLQQTNGYDCGIHVLCMADHLADHINRYGYVEGVDVITLDTVRTKRAHIIKIITSLSNKRKY